MFTILPLSFLIGRDGGHKIKPTVGLINFWAEEGMRPADCCGVLDIAISGMRFPTHPYYTTTWGKGDLSEWKT